MHRMPPYRFALVAHSPDLVTAVRAIVDEGELDGQHPFELEVRLCNFDTAVPVARDCLAQGAEVVICHGGTGNSIVEAVRHPVVAIERTDMDLINTLKDAARIEREIILAAHRQEVHDIETIEELLNVKIHNVVYPDSRMLFQEVDKLFAKGVRVLVGGGASKSYMDSLGGAGFVIVTNRQSIRRALVQAGNLVARKRRELEMYNDLRAVFSQLDEGVVFLRGDGSEAFVNSKARSLLGQNEGRGSAAAASHYAKLHLFECLEDHLPRNDVFVDIGGAQLVVTTLPVTLEQGRSGAVALFRDLPSVQKTSRKIGEELYARGFIAKKGLDDIQGKSAPLQRLKEKILRFAPSAATVLIHGETGTGKELVAHALHRGSARGHKPFVAVNFAALSEHLLESELFGYEDGAFTGARRGGRTGLFELADGGTLFLDEVGEISPELQLRLLRVLEAKEILRVGGTRFLPVDVRVICASHKRLPDLVQEGRFRADLYYRLSTLKLGVPPLRERLEDVPLLVRDLLARYGKTERCLCCGIDEAIREYSWPGNVRELLAVMESYLVQLPDDMPDEDLFHAILAENAAPSGAIRAGGNGFFVPGAPMRELLHNARKRIISEAVAYHDGNKQLAAVDLGICYSTLWRSYRE